MSDYDLSDEDLTHVARLQALQESGMVNMFTDCKRGLEAMLDPEEAEATYEWVTENFELFMSGEYIDIDVHD